MVWVVLLKFPLFLREVLCATLPLQLLSEDSLAAYLVIKDRHFLGVALPVPGRALLELAIATDLAGNPLGCVLLVVVLTLLHEQCFAVHLIMQEGLLGESSWRSVAGAGLGMGGPPEVSALLARGALCNLAAAVAVRGPARHELALQGLSLFTSCSSCTWPCARGGSFRRWSCRKSCLVVPTLLHELCFAVPLILQEGLMDESLGLAVLLSRELLLVQLLLLKFPLVFGEVLCATLPLHLLSKDLCAANSLFKDRLFSGVSLRVPGRALLEVAIAGGLAGNALG